MGENKATQPWEEVLFDSQTGHLSVAWLHCTHKHIPSDLGRLVGWLVGRSVGRLVIVACLVAQLLGCSVARLLGCLVD